MLAAHRNGTCAAWTTAGETRGFGVENGWFVMGFIGILEDFMGLWGILYVSTAMGIPKLWFVCNGTSQSKMDDDLGVPLFLETSKWKMAF